MGPLIIHTTSFTYQLIQTCCERHSLFSIELETSGPEIRYEIFRPSPVVSNSGASMASTGTGAELGTGEVVGVEIRSSASKAESDRDILILHLFKFIIENIWAFPSVLTKNINLPMEN
ncbi:hypothetical protein C0J52_00489 [Blattella germanica]|nr:hypothetical protein C0J52_00489 [Blattella germanica]